MDGLLEKYQNRKSNSWTLKDAEGIELTTEEIANKRSELQSSIKQLESAEFIHKTGISKVVGAESTMLYKGDKASADLIKKKHKDQGDTVTGPDKNGIITVTTKDGTITYLPEGGEASVVKSFASELMTNTALSGHIRLSNSNVMAVDLAKLPEVEKLFSGKGDKWVKIGDNLYMGETTRNGKPVKMFFIPEESLNVANDALKAEQNNPGTGLSVINANLRGDAAKEGFADFMERDWKGMTEGQMVLEAWKLEQKGKSDGKSLNEIFEERKKEKVTREKLEKQKAEQELLKNRGKLIGATGDSYPEKEMLAQYKDEEKGAYFDTPTGDPLFVKYFKSDAERAPFEVFVGEKDGLVYDAEGNLLDTQNSDTKKRSSLVVPADAIFVMDTKGRIFLSKHSAYGEFHHSTFLGGDPVGMAGEANIVKGGSEYSKFNNNSGHYSCDNSYLDNIRIELEKRGAKMDNLGFEPFKK